MITVEKQHLCTSLDQTIMWVRIQIFLYLIKIFSICVSPNQMMLVNHITEGDEISPVANALKLQWVNLKKIHKLLMNPFFIIWKVAILDMFKNIFYKNILMINLTKDMMVLLTKLAVWHNAHPTWNSPPLLCSLPNMTNVIQYHKILKD